MSAAVYVYRSDLLEPHAVPWSWSQHDTAGHLQMRPRYARLRDGRWMQLHQVEGEIVSGHIMAWEQFALMMANNRRNVGLLAAKRNAAGVFLMIGAGLLLYGVQSLQDRPGVVGLVCSLVGFGLGLGGLKEAVTAAFAMTNYVVIDPGHNLYVRPSQQMPPQQMYGGTTALSPEQAAAALAPPQRAPSFPWKASTHAKRLGNK